MERRQPPGFTLIELLVALALFAITTGVIADLFMLATRQHVRTRAWTRVQSDARLVLDTITRELREGTVDYAALLPNELALRDADGRAVRFRRSVSACAGSAPACVEIGRGNPDGTMTWAPLTGTDTDVRAFNFRVHPADDPFAWNAAANMYRADAQPTVTVRLHAVAVAGRPSPESDVQTTIVSRVYRR